MDASSSLLVASNELADELFGHVLEAAVGCVIHILHVHLGFVNSQVLFWVRGPIIEIYSRHLNLSVARSIDDLGAKRGREGKQRWPSAYPRHFDGGIQVAVNLDYRGTPPFRSAP